MCPVPALARSQSKPAVGAPSRIGDSCTFYSFRTSSYKSHFLESPSGLKARGDGMRHGAPWRQLLLPLCHGPLLRRSCMSMYACAKQHLPPIHMCRRSLC